MIELIANHHGIFSKILLRLAEYIEELVQANATGAKKFCEGTFLNPGSWGAALLAAGTTLSAVKHILDGHGNLAYALVRPPAIVRSPAVQMATAF